MGDSFLYKKVTGTLFILCAAQLILGCAGPATPFGAVNFVKGSEESSGWNAGSYFSIAVEKWLNPSDVAIEITPGAQVFHRRSDVDVRIHDSAGMSENAVIRVIYNGYDVTDNFIKLPSKTTHEVHLQFLDLRLNPRKLHNIEVSYQHNSETQVFAKKFGSPICELEKHEPLRSVAGFSVDAKVINNLNQVSHDENINPTLLAGLVAQESKFNSQAVSSFRAIGLTQVTHAAEDDILDDIQHWPRYPGIRDMSFVELKYKIYSKTITPAKEWRLRPELSLRGGALYLSHLEDYWNSPQKRELIEKSQASYPQVLLASYNIGGKAVSGALERGGADWLKDEEGSRALNYVQMIGSYCQDFSQGQKDADE